MIARFDFQMESLCRSVPGAVMQGDQGDCATAHSTIERGSVRSDMARVGGSGKHSQLNDAEEGVEASFCWEMKMPLEVCQTSIFKQ